MSTTQRIRFSAICRHRAIAFLILLFAALEITPLYAQSITLVAIDPATASPNTPVSVTAGGFTAGTPSPTTTVTLTPQGGGTAINTPSVVTGNGIGRSINFLAPSAAAGLYNVTATGAGLSSQNSLTLTLTGPPAFTLNPVSGPQGATVQVTITGSGTTFPSGLTTANFGAGISVGGAAAGASGPVVVQPNGTAVATLNIAAGAALGGRSVTVTGSDTITQANAFTVTSSGIRTLTLIAIDPATGPVNTPVSITASGFAVGIAAPPFTVTLTPQGGGAVITTNAVVTGTALGRSINFVVPSGSAAGPYNVTAAGTGYVSGNSFPFTITGPPSFTLNPATGAQGADPLQVVITGANTTFPVGSTTANFGAGISVGGAAEGATGFIAVQPNGTAIATLRINPGAAIGSRTVVVSGLETITQANAFAVTSATRTLTLIAIDPTNGTANTPVSVTASGFAVGVAAPPFIVTLTPSGGGVPFTTNAVVTGTALGRSINFVVPPGAAAGPYNVTASGTGYVSGNSLPFTIVGSPSFTLNPINGAQGATIDVLITGSNTSFPPGSTTANFGQGISVGGAAEGATGPVTVQPNGTAIAHLVINPTATLGGRTVTLFGLNTITQSNAFAVTSGTQSLTLIAVDPAMGPVNTPVSITASGFAVGVTAPPFTVTLTPQGGGASITTTAVVTGTALGRSINFVVPPGTAAGVYNLTASGAGYVSGNSLPFTVNAAPSFTISPSSGVQGATTLQVLITGSNTTFPPGSTTASFGPGISVGGGAYGSPGVVAVQSNNSAIATLTISPGATLGGRTVSVYGQDTIPQANAFMVTPAPQITGVLPDSAQQNQSQTVTITGLNTNFTSSSAVSFGLGVNVNSVTFNSPTSLSVHISVLGSAPAGARDVTVTTNGTPLTGAGLFTVLAATPQITSVFPNSAQQNQSLAVTITGLNTNFSALSTVSFGAGVMVNAVSFNSPTSLTANISVQPAATPGARDVIVTTEGVPVTGIGLFTVVGAPRILSVSPASGEQGQTLPVVITAENASFSASSIVSFGGGITVDSFTLNGPASLIANIRIDPEAALGLRNVTVTTEGISVTGSSLFSVTQAKAQQIISVAPSTGQQDQTLNVVITGLNTLFNGQSLVSFGSGVTVNSVLFNSATSLSVNLTVSAGATPGPRDVTVTTSGNPVTGSGLFSVTATPPQITSVLPSSARQSQTTSVTIIGSNTNFTNLSSVGFGAGITVNNVVFNSATSLTANITVQAAATPGLRDVTVTTSGTPVTGAALFTVLASPPQITGVSPNAAPQNQTLSVIITGSNTSFTNQSTVSFGAGITVNGVTFVNATTLNANLTVQPSAATGLRDVIVTTGGIPLTGSGLFTVQLAPAQITSVTPGSAQQGQTLNVSITGFNTTFTSGSTANFGSGVTVNSLTFISPTSLLANVTIAANAGLGARDVTVTTGGIPLTGSGLFTITPSPARITSVAPNMGEQGQTFAVTIAGSNTTFSAQSTVSLGSGITINSVTFNSAVSLTANITIAAGATVGTRDVTVITDGSPLTGSGLFTVKAAPPHQLLSVTPSTGLQGATLTVSITGSGTNFTAASIANFGAGITVNSVSLVSATSLNANITIAQAATAGPRDVTVTTGGVPLTGSGLFTVAVLPAQITNVQPNSGQQGSSVQVTITGSNTNFSTQSVVSFGAGLTVTSITVGGPTTLTVNVNIAPGATVGPRDVTVTTNGTPVIGVGMFTVTAGTPRLVSVSPNTVTQGQTTTLTITGEFTNFQQGVTQVSLGQGITIGSTTISSPTSIAVVVTVAPDATLGSRTLTITTGAEQLTLAGAVTVAVSGPALTLIDPNSARPGQSLNVRIVGSLTHFTQAASQVNFGAGITVNSVSVVNGTSLNANLTILPDATLGGRTVTVTTGAEVASLANGFFVLSGGQAQPLSCVTNAGVPPLVRAEGFTELVGDVLIVCTGGSAGQTSAVNVQLFLNTQITSRVIDNQSEALLIVDELGYNASPGPITPAVYRAVPAQGENALVWTNVQITAPGPSGQRVIRITNVRANATTLGTSTSLVPTQVVAFLSVSPSNSLPLSSPQQIVGYVQPGLVFDVTNCDTSVSGSAITSGQFVQCIGENAAANRDLLTGTDGNMQFAVRFKEGFQTAFKPRIAADQQPSTPGVVYNSESGFLRTPDYPYGVGGATTGTKLVARFTNVPAGARLFVTTVPSTGSTAGFNATLVSLPPGQGSAKLFCPLAAGEGVAATELEIVNGSATAVWEVTATNSAAIESAVFGVAVAYAPNTPNKLPGLGQASVAGNLGPFYAAGSDAGRMSATLPIPRFVDSPTRVNAFRIDSCVTNLLFPFVTNQAGFDTGIAVSNTSRDPFGNVLRPQSGACTINYYGGTPSGGAAPPPQKSNTGVEAGSTMTFVLSSGGSHGISPTPGFQGYLIVQCDFRYAHGFAFITDGPIGSARVAEGYLGLVMDAGAATRGSSSEGLSH